ncbi:MAG TPA: MFS transporter [Candidatus Hydrogenedentes bacterium]|nr:MFS transporter [Candidatus Hydrogenedentota bacterium]HPG66129.1 MFS transporter [Candidatus Hydrogenedentota bacterium]
MRVLFLEGVFVQTMYALTTGAFLVGFALLWGASNKVIGILSAIGPLSQTLQVPAVYLVEKTRHRKALLVSTSAVSRIVWMVVAVIPFFAPRSLIIPCLLAALAVHWGLGAIGGCAFNSWLRDLIPETSTATFFARRFALAIGAGALFSLAGGYGVDVWREWFGSGGGAYSVLFALAALFGVASSVLLAHTPEPQMPPGEGMTFAGIIREPLRNRNYRHLLVFLGWWSFAINLAAPFFAVYLLERLGLSMAWVLALTVLSQLVNVSCFNFWARLADRFSNKSVLTVCGPMFIMTLLLWPLTTLPDPYVMTIPILLLIHVLAGISTAGITLCSWNLALKSAPYGKGASYLAVNALISGLAASISPIIGGFAADWFASEELTLTLRLVSSVGRHREYLVPTIDFQGLDFVFLIAFVLGLYSLHRLLSVREKGDVDETIVRQAVLVEMGRAIRQVSTVAGVREVLVFPSSLIRQLRRKGAPRPSGPTTADDPGRIGGAAPL